ncbi:hypothetical protein ATP_00400 [Candidatus Phytoplasma mali]|uniref:Uncharacterized protein n=1 Tax=Phytoplasma mali (strain AT) TaxID=482235 RepID=B3QZI0_PHYMT|nr:hypothetical protein [Candidatus Phytoplasma mali]CAP18587.1 hypothetical protein ATP_00400 [Candidatus Phytoplasma mali]
MVQQNPNLLLAILKFIFNFFKQVLILLCLFLISLGYLMKYSYLTSFTRLKKGNFVKLYYFIKNIKNNV